MSIWTIILVNVLPLLALTYWYFKWKFSYWEKKGVPGPKPSWIFGNTIQNLRRGNRYADMEYFEKYGKIWGHYSGTRPFLNVCDADLIKQIMIKDFHAFINRRTNTGTHPIWSKNLFAAEDNAWKRIRTILSPTFTSGKLKGMSTLMLESVDKLNDYFAKLAKEKKPFDVKKVISGFTIDVIASTSFAMDTDSNGDRQKENPVLYHGTRLFKMSVGRLLTVRYIPEPFRTWTGFNIEFTPEHFNFFSHLMKRIIQQRREKGIRRDDLTQLLIDATEEDFNVKDNNWNKLTASADNFDETDNFASQNNKENVNKKASSNGKTIQAVVEKRMNDNEIIAQSILFFVAGFETTATTLTNVLYELAMNPNIQERLFDELNQHLSDMDPLSGEYYDKVNNSIPYLNACIKETLRKYPPVPKLFRRCDVEGYKLGDVELFKGQNVEIPVFAVHYNPEYYPEPETFNPERFLNKDEYKKLPYLSFGDGPRNCIGMRFAYVEIRLCLANLIRNYRILPAENTPKILTFQKIGVSSTLPFDLCVEKR